MEPGASETVPCSLRAAPAGGDAEASSRSAAVKYGSKTSLVRSARSSMSGSRLRGFCTQDGGCKRPDGSRRALSRAGPCPSRALRGENPAKWPRARRDNANFHSLIRAGSLVVAARKSAVLTPLPIYGQLRRQHRLQLSVLRSASLHIVPQLHQVCVRHALLFFGPLRATRPPVVPLRQAVWRSCRAPRVRRGDRLDLKEVGPKADGKVIYLEWVSRMSPTISFNW